MCLQEYLAQNREKGLERKLDELSKKVEALRHERGTSSAERWTSVMALLTSTYYLLLTTHYSLLTTPTGGRASWSQPPRYLVITHLRCFPS